MNILFINPCFPSSLWDFSYCRDLDGSKYPHYPLALPTLAGLTPSCHHVSLCDENIQTVDVEADVDLVGLTGYSIQRDRIIELANAFRARGVMVAVGGPIVGEGNYADLTPHADVVFLGEAEEIWPQFLSDLAAGVAQPVYKAAAFPSLEGLPAPRFELLDLKSYSTATIETGRGCPFTCEFCSVPVRLGRNKRMKSIDGILHEVKTLYELGVDSIFFVDDHFIGNRKFVIELLQNLASFIDQTNGAIYFTCQFTINFARDDAMLTLMRAANFRRVFIGIESPNPESLKECGKRQNMRVDLVESIRKIQSYNIIVWASLIIGFDHDDFSVVEQQKILLQHAGVPVAMMGILQALPETPLYDRMNIAGRIKTGDAPGGIAAAESTMIKSNILQIPSGDFAERDWGKLLQRLVVDVYDYSAFGNRLVDVIQQGERPLRKDSRPISLQEIFLLFRIIRYYLFSFNLKRSFLFLRVITAAILHDSGSLHAALLHLVVYKHLRMFYYRVAKQSAG